jgi:anti-anti-sigma factor
MQTLKMGVETRDAVQILTVSGFMNMANVPVFVQTLAGLIQDGHSKIVLNLSALEYISSAGLGEIIARIRDLRRNGGDIKIGGYSHLVFEILKTFGFTDVFETYPTLEEAVRRFSV